MSYKILQVSDYLTLIWGIEMYVYTTSKLLRKQWMVVETIWLHCSSSLLNKIRPLLLPLTLFNLYSAILLCVRFFSYKPDVIWFHSVSRFHGWLPVFISYFLKSHRLMIYHDLWYFHPFPRYVTQERQVLPWWFINWMRMSISVVQQTMRWRYWFKTLFSGALMIVWSLCKFVSMSLLRWSLLNTVHTHIVPSDFMVQYLLDWGVKKSSIEVLPHFVVGTKED